MVINKFYVYSLIDPETNIPFYIGKGCGNRMFIHEKIVKSGKITNNNIHLTEKIKSIILNNRNIIYKKLYENVNNNDAIKSEIELIKNIGRVDLLTGPLYNLTDGGEGITNVSDETKQKLRTSHLGKQFSDKHKENLKKAAKNRTKEHIEKISLKNRGKRRSEETKLKISLSKRGKSNFLIKGREVSDETKEKISNSIKSYFSNVDNRKKLSKKMLENPTFIKTWYFINPDGNRIKIDNLSKFCRENNLYYECMKRLHRGIRKSYRGWKRDENSWG